MATKIKPQRIQANNSPSVGQVPKYVDETTFERGAGGGGSLDVGDLFYADKVSTIGYSERQDYYMLYEYEENPATLLHTKIYVYNGKGAPIMKSSTQYRRDNTYTVSINASNYGSQLDFFHILADGSAFTFQQMRGWYTIDYAVYNGYKIDDLDSLSPTRTPLTFNFNTAHTTNNRHKFIGFDGTYYYVHRYDAGVYERYSISGTNVNYVDTWVPPLGLVPTYIRGQYIYIVSSNVIHEYDISTGVETTSGQYIGTRHWDFDDAVWTNINTTGDMHAIYKAFSH